MILIQCDRCPKRQKIDNLLSATVNLKRMKFILDGWLTINDKDLCDKCTRIYMNEDPKDFNIFMKMKGGKI